MKKPKAIVPNIFGMRPDLGHITDPIERDMAYRVSQTVAYCKHCGKQILPISEDENGFKVDFQWEMQNKAHYKCHTKWSEEERAKAIQREREEEARRQKELEEFDWEQYMADKLANREEE